MYLRTSRLDLEPVSLSLVEAVILGRRDVAERLVDAELPPAWPNRALVERAFSASLDAIRSDPARRLWGDRLMILRDPGDRWEMTASQRLLVERSDRVGVGEARAAPHDKGIGDRWALPSGHRKGKRRVVGSVVFHGLPEDGVAEVAYGVEDGSQGQGFATEATSASVEWALAEPGIVAVQATTVPWHIASLRVIAKLGMKAAGSREHEILGELLVFERRR